MDGDGCSSTCTIEDDWECSTNITSGFSECNDICGDGIMAWTRPTDYCDDGDTDDGDGCDSTCTVEDGWL